MNESNNFLIPIAVIIAGALIAWGLMSDKTPSEPNNNGEPAKVTFAPVTAEDHILGDPGADLIIVEYSDFECSHCRNFHFTTKKIMDEYGKDGKVALVFRQFPLRGNAKAIASECAAELGGDTKFWVYVNTLFESTPQGNEFDLNELPNIAEQIGLDRAEFTACLEDEKIAEKVAAQQKIGVESGVSGTPYPMVISKDGRQTLIQGAQPYDVVKLMIDTLLSE